MKSIKRMLLGIGLLTLSLMGLSGELSLTAQTQLEKGLIGYWKFDEGKGDIAFDASGNKNDGKVKCVGEGCSPPKWVKGKIGFAIEFDGVDDQVEVADSVSLKFGTGPLSISMWIKIEDIGAIGFLLGKGDANTVGFDILYRGDHKGEVGKRTLQFRLNDGSSPIAAVLALARTPVADLQWRHLVFVIDRRAKSVLYLDGEPKATADLSAKSGTIDTKSSLYMGLLGKWRLKGILDEVRIYNRTLSGEEVKKLFQMKSTQP